MKLSDLAKKANQLPEIHIDWGGIEHWHDDIFNKEIQTIEDAKKYIDGLRQRMQEYSMALHELANGYEKLKEFILEAEVEHD